MLGVRKTIKHGSCNQERGFFWWLHEPEGGTNSYETAVSGLLTISGEGRIDLDLDLDGALWYEDSATMKFDQPQFVPREKFITGRLAEQEGGLRFVLLKDLERTSFELPTSKRPHPESYRARYCFGNHNLFDITFAVDDFSQMRINLVGLEEWLSLDSLSTAIEYVDNERVEVRVRYGNRTFRYRSEDGSLSIESIANSGVQTPYPQRSLTFQQEEWLVYTPASDSTVASILENFLRLEELFALLFGSYFRLDWPILVRRGDSAGGSWHQTYSFRGILPDFKPERLYTWTNFHIVKGTFRSFVLRVEEAARRFRRGLLPLHG